MADNFSSFDKFAPLAKQVVNHARQEAKWFKHEQVSSIHLLLGMLGVGTGAAHCVLTRKGVRRDQLRKEVKTDYPPDGDAEISDPRPFSGELDEVLAQSVKECETLKHDKVDTGHLLLGLLAYDKSRAAALLRKCSFDIDEIRQETTELLIESSAPVDDSDDREEDSETGDETKDDRVVVASDSGPSAFTSRSGRDSGTGDSVKTDCPTLWKYGYDLTALIADGKRDPVIGRSEEIQRVIQILCRKTKNNPVLIGEAGVGKTAVVEGLAEAIVARKVPEELADKIVFALDLSSLVGGTQYRGTFEERINRIIKEVSKSRRILLFIDELHSIVGAGDSREGTMDAANILKPALARGEIKCIGATTFREYRESIEKDAALERRFQPVTVQPPNLEDSCKILEGLRESYETFHRVRFEKGALEAAVSLSDRYITGRFLPDKAIDVIDEAGSRARISGVRSPIDTSAIEKELEEVELKKSEAIESQNFEEAAQWRDKARALHSKLEEIKNQWHANYATVTCDDIAAVVSSFTGIPIQKMSADMQQRLLQMEEELKKTVVGQDEAVKVVSQALRRRYAKLKAPNRPIGTFIFLGPTGVGKTLLAKALADFMFDDPEALIRVDMSEYAERSDVSRLIGASPGYIGYDEAGQLTEPVRRRPYSVILVDEIEKAHPAVLPILLQVLDEGALTDSHGRKVDFRNTVVILTSNLGAYYQGGAAPMGFGGGKKSDPAKELDPIVNSARKLLPKEFINRFDDVIAFKPLERTELSMIVKLELDKLAAGLAETGKSFEATESALAYLLDKGFDPEYGARPIRRAIEKFIENPLAEELLRGNFDAAQGILVDCVDDSLVFSAVAPKRKSRKKK